MESTYLSSTQNKSRSPIDLELPKGYERTQSCNDACGAPKFRHMDGADTDDEEPSSSARRHSGYKLEWLQSISLEGLQCLAKIHDLDPSADVPELIEGLRPLTTD